MKNKIILIISTSIIILGLLTIILYNEIPRIKYKYDEDLAGYVIYKTYGNVKTYDIKTDKEIVGIARDAFRNKNKLEYLDLSNTNIKTIGNSAFSGCHNLKHIKFNDSLEYVDTNAFKDSGIINLDFSKTDLKYLGGGCFFETYDLKEITLPNNEVTISSYCFYNSSIEKINYYNLKLLDYSLYGINEDILNKIGDE